MKKLKKAKTERKIMGDLRIRAEFGSDSRKPGAPLHFCYHSIMDEAHSFVASTWAGFTEEESEKVATLLAAAPQMLRVIQEADAWLSFNQHPDADQIRVFRTSLQEAIHKATDLN